MQRIFIGWVIFLPTIFNGIDLKPATGFLLKKKCQKVLSKQDTV